MRRPALLQARSRKKYGIRIAAVDPKGVGTAPAEQAVKDGTDQMVPTTTTDATLRDFGLVLLEDDTKLRSADNVLPVVNAESADGKDVRTVLGNLTKVLTTRDLVQMNRRVDAERRKPADAAREYLESKGLIAK